MEKEIKLDRVMELFFRAMKGESLSVQQLAFEYNVSTRSITRDINSLKAFLADHADILGYAELEYSSTCSANWSVPATTSRILPKK